MFGQNRGLPPLLSNRARGGPHGLLVTDIWGPAHRPNLDGVLLCWGDLRRDSRGPSYVTILYVALHLTQLLPYLKQGGWICANTQPDTVSRTHAQAPQEAGTGSQRLKPLWGAWFGNYDLCQESPCRFMGVGGQCHDPSPEPN